MYWQILDEEVFEALNVGDEYVAVVMRSLGDSTESNTSGTPHTISHRYTIVYFLVAVDKILPKNG
jgi:hypothetical protein